MARLIVTGGAGYIGSHTALLLRRLGHEVTIVDNLSSGRAEFAGESQLIEADVTVPGVLTNLVSETKAEGIFHFAAKIQVEESVRSPEQYFATNIGGTIQVCVAAAGKKIPVIFSSTAAVYGEPEQTPIPVDHPCRPTSPYGTSKKISEELLFASAEAHGFGCVALRYFNAAGAEPDSGLREQHDPETHLIPLAIGAATGKIPTFNLFGEDWPTPDGSCVRDFVHVMDLAEAHVKAFDYLKSGRASRIFNLGSGVGTSVKEIIQVIEQVTKRTMPLKISPRRRGDVAQLVADISQTQQILDWKSKQSDIATIAKHALHS